MRLAGLLDAACDAMLVAAADGSILFINQEGERLLGCLSAQIVGRSVRSLLSSADHGDDDWLVCSGPLQHRCCMKMRAREGHELSAELTISAVSTSAGQQYLIIVRPAAGGEAGCQASHDETELLHAVRLSAMDEVASTLVHKLNQPLTAVILYLQAIERAYARETDGGSLPRNVASILEKAVHEAERASSMLQSLRRGHDANGCQFADVNQAVEDAIDLAGLRARKGSYIDRFLTPNLPPVPVERAALQQALAALIRGALDEAGGRHSDGIRLTTACARGRVAVVAELASREGGESADNCALSTNGRRNCEKELAVARAIAQSHGGDLVVDADRRGHGARFTLRLPLPAGTASSA